MSEAAQEVDTSIVDDTPVPNEAEIQDEPKREVESETKETDEESPEVEQKSVEERLAELEKDNESKQTAINRRTAALSQANKKIEELQREYKEVQSKLLPEEPAEKPKIEDFESYEEFQSANEKYIRKDAEAKAIKKVQEEQLEAQRQKVVEERNALVSKQEAEYIQTNPNYFDSLTEFQSFVNAAQVDPAVEHAIVDQAFKGSVPQVIDYFAGNNGENLDQLGEISRMSPIDAAIEIYKIQQTLKAPEKKETKPAPAPVNKPKGGGKPRKNLADGDVLRNLGLKD